MVRLSRGEQHQPTAKGTPGGGARLWTGAGRGMEQAGDLVLTAGRTGQWWVACWILCLWQIVGDWWEEGCWWSVIEGWVGVMETYLWQRWRTFVKLSVPLPKRGWGCLESQCCHLISLSCLLSFFCFVFLLFLSHHFLLMVHFHWLPPRKLTFFIKI